MLVLRAARGLRVLHLEVANQNEPQEAEVTGKPSCLLILSLVPGVEINVAKP